MSTPHRASREEREMLELRNRLDCLKLRCEVQLQQLTDLQDRHRRLADSVRLLEREVVTDGPQPEPLTSVTGKGVIVEGQFDYSGTTYVYKTAAQPAPATEESSAAAPPPLRCPGAHTIAECGGPCEQDFRLCDCGLLQQLNPAPATEEPSAPAPAGSLVERVASICASGSSLEPELWDQEARAAIREVAAWLRVESKGHLGSGAHWAHRIEQEADR